MMTPWRNSDAGERRAVRSRGLGLLVVLVLMAASCSSSHSASDPTRPQVTVNAPQGCDIVGCAGDGVDTNTGSYTVDESDLFFPSGVYGVELDRGYRSDRDTSGPFGRGWATVYDTTLKSQGRILVVDAPLGLAPLWRPEAPIGWTVGGSPTINRTASGAELVWPTGERWVFNSAGELVTLSSPYGQTVTVERVTGSPTVIRSSQGPMITLTVTNGNVTTATTNDGRTVSYDYTGGSLTKVATPGAASTYAYNAEGLLVHTTNAAGVTIVGYANGTVADQTAASGKRLTFTYDNGVAIVTGAETLRYEHDDAGRLVKALSGDNELSVREYDDAGHLTEATDYMQPGQQVLRSIVRTYDDERLASETVNGLKTSIRYDSAGRVTSLTAGPDATTYTYASSSPLPATVTSPTRGRDELTYSNGFITSVVDATGAATATIRDTQGNPISHAVGNQPAWTYTFDAEGNITETKSPSGRTWTSTWAPRSRLVQERNPLGQSTIYQYDPAGRLTRQETPGGQTRTLTYNTIGQLSEETGTDQQTIRYEYDPNGRLAATVMPGEHVWRTTTEPAVTGGTSVTVTAPDGTYTVTRLDSIGREIERHTYEADGYLVETREQTFAFDLPTTTTTTRGQSKLETTTTYDSSGHPTSKTETLDGLQTTNAIYTFENGLLTTAAAGDETARYEYDPAGRLTTITTNTDTWKATYRTGQLTATLHNGDTTSIGYDLDGRANIFTDSNGINTAWTFDGADRPTTRSVGEATATFYWSADGRLSGYHAPDGSRWGWSYDGAGRLINAVEPGGITTTYGYEIGAVTRIRTKGADHDRDDKYTYDARGQIRTAETSDGKHQYGYDATGHVTTIDDTETWTYDAAGQLDTVTTGSDVYTFTYDTSGHLQQISNGDKSLTASWTHDVLTTVQAPGRDPIGLTTDNNGRLTSVNWNNDTTVDINWPSTDESFTVQQHGKTTSQHYNVADGTLTGYTNDKLHIESTQQPNGYLKAITLAGEDNQAGQIKFDELGRPATLVTDAADTTISYDNAGRVASVLTSRPDDPPQQTTITYTADGRHIDGDKAIIDSLFTDDGSLRTPLPSSLANPTSTASTSDDIAGAASAAGVNLLTSPQPAPLDQIRHAITASTPQIVAPAGVRDLSRLAEQMVTAEVARLAPTIRVNGAVSIHIPVINPKNGTAADFNPYVDAAPSGLALGLLNKQNGGGNSLFDQAMKTIDDIVGGVALFTVEAISFVISNPVARLIISAGSFSLAVVACAPPAIAACLPVAALAVALVAQDSAQSLIASIPHAWNSCTGAQLARCGLEIAQTAVAVGAVFAAVRVGTSIFEIYGAQRALSAALSSGEGVAVASGQVGTARSELLAALRFDRVAAREVDVVADGTTARLDLVTKTIVGRHRLVEVKNGAAARFTANQQVVYPALQSVGAYFPNGLLNSGSPETLAATVVQVQHWGTSLPLSLP